MWLQWLDYMKRKKEHIEKEILFYIFVFSVFWSPILHSLRVSLAFFFNGIKLYPLYLATFWHNMLIYHFLFKLSKHTLKHCESFYFQTNWSYTVVPVLWYKTLNISESNEMHFLLFFLLTLIYKLCKPMFWQDTK